MHGDGVKTYQAKLNELFALIDKDKITRNAYLFNFPYYYRFQGYYAVNGTFWITCTNTFSVDGVTFYIESVVIKPSGSIWSVLNMINNRYPQINTATTAVYPVNGVLRFYY